MSTDAIIEYRAVWPGGEPAEGLACDNRTTFFEMFDDFTRKLTGLSIPQKYFPRVEARIVEKVRYDWKPYGDTEKDYAAAQTAQVHITGMPMPLTPTRAQVARVREGKFQADDPCVICGQPFTQCLHTGAETHNLVTLIQEGGYL